MKNIEKIKPSGIFTNYIFKSIPLAFDESMSYYEVLCGVLNLLKTQEEIINNNADLLAELESYVKNYFNNLNVQEEINNKLDEMVETGELQEIIADYLGSKTVWGFDNVADMKANTNLLNGSYARTMGYYNSNDKGGALYRITNTLDTNSHQETLNNGLYATLIVTSYVTPEMFGAYGDGLHDDTEAIKKSIKYNVKGNKEYLIQNSIDIKNNVKLELSSVIYGNNNYAFIIHGRFNNIKINNFTSNFGGIFTTSLELNDGHFIEQNILEVGNSLTGKEVLKIYANASEITETIQHYGVQYNIFKFKRCILNENANCNTVDLRTSGISSLCWINENTFQNCGLFSHQGINKNYSVYLNSDNNNVRDNNFYNCSIEGTNKGVFLGDSNINWYGGRFERTNQNYMQVFERIGNNAPTSYIYSGSIVSMQYNSILVPNSPMNKPYFMIFTSFINQYGSYQKIWADGIYETDGYLPFIDIDTGTTYGYEINITNSLFACRPLLIKNTYDNNFINVRINSNITNLPNFKICEVISDKDSAITINVAPLGETTIIDKTIYKNQKITFYTNDNGEIVYKVEPYNKSNFYTEIASFNGKSSSSYNSILHSLDEFKITTIYNDNGNYYILEKTINRSMFNLYNDSNFSFSDYYDNGTDKYLVRWTCSQGTVTLRNMYKNGIELTEQEYENVVTKTYYK